MINRCLRYLVILFLVLGGACAQFERVPSSIDSNHLSQETAMHLLQSTVRVSVENPFGCWTGSGVIVYSHLRSLSLDPRSYSYVLTCAHVIHDATRAEVESFYYLENSTIVSTAKFSAEVVAINREIDVAVLQITTPRPLQATARPLPSSQYYQHQIYTPVYVIGCALGNQPSITNGNISSLEVNHNVDGRMMHQHLKITSATIYGNSGGGVFNQAGQLMGLTESIDVTRGSPVPHSAYAVPMWQIALFLKEEGLGFLVGEPGDPDTFFQIAANRKQNNQRLADEQQFRKSFLDALDKLNNISPVVSVTVIVGPTSIPSTLNPSVAPIQSLHPSVAPIQSPTSLQPPLKRTWH